MDNFERHNKNGVIQTTENLQKSYQDVSVPKSLENIHRKLSENKSKKGLIVVWPQRRKYYRNKELVFSTWMIAHALFWMHLLQLFPTDHVLNLRCPPWNYEPPLRKPETRDFIIEPDWSTSTD